MNKIFNLKTDFYIVLSMLFLLCSCSTINLQDLAQENHFKVRSFQTPSYLLKALFKAGNNQVLHVYIEGDGSAWKNKSTPSSDPTPRNPIGFKLARADKSRANILYLARPGQYLNKEELAKLTYEDWTSKRLSNESLQAYNYVLNLMKNELDINEIKVYGYSGGGGIAALLAATRDDIIFLGTFAGNVDTVAWTNFHRVTPLENALNPIDYAEKTKDIPQVLYSGERDTIIPPFIAEAWCKKVPKAECVTIKNYKHTSEWEKILNIK